MAVPREKNYWIHRCKGGAGYMWDCPKCNALKKKRQSEAAHRGVQTRRRNYPNWGRPENSDRQWATRASTYVRAAIRAGLLPNLKTEKVACVDCGARAKEWEHRDYERPLDVEPVCLLCNKKRGTAKWPQPRLDWAPYKES